MFKRPAAALPLLLAACQPAVDGGPGASPIAEGSAAPFAAIGAEEAIRFTGTEPFWGGTVTGTRLLWQTPENIDGETLAVRRFAGNNGLAYTGTVGEQSFDMTITPGTCSDGMSDRAYPYTVTLKLGAEQRHGCAWTARQPYRDIVAP